MNPQVYLLIEEDDFQGAVELTTVVAVFADPDKAEQRRILLANSNPGLTYRIDPRSVE